MNDEIMRVLLEPHLGIETRSPEFNVKREHELIVGKRSTRSRAQREAIIAIYEACTKGEKGE